MGKINKQDSNFLGFLSPSEQLVTTCFQLSLRYNFRVCQQYGDDIAAAVFAMTLSGGVRYILHDLCGKDWRVCREA